MELDPLVDVEDQLTSTPSVPRRCRRFQIFAAGSVSLFVVIFYSYRHQLHWSSHLRKITGLRSYFPEIWVSPHVTRTLVGSDPTKLNHGVMVSVSDISNAKETTIKQFHNLTHWPPAKLQNAGKDCWQPCGNVSGDCAWCGAGNACCRFNAEHDPDECTGVTFTERDRHTCVTPTGFHAVKHARQDCLPSCGRSGYCKWCGEGHACCMESAKSIEAPECRGAFGFHRHNRYECVATLGSCEFMEVADGESCKKPDKPQSLAFYMYKAAGPNYPMSFNETGSMGTLGGVMWYLHNDVVTQCPRRYGVDRIRRYFVTVKSTDALYAATARMFDRYSDFEDGKAAESWMIDHWTKYGYNPGCLHVDPAKTQAAYENAVWYSLPGKCPSRDIFGRTAKCLRQEQGGNCDAPDGTRTCTWHAQFAGEVFLDELANIPDPATFCSSGKYEFDLETDAGIGSDFWNGKISPAACNNRMKRVYGLFEQKYPGMPRLLNRHPCDAEIQTSDSM